MVDYGPHEADTEWICVGVVTRRVRAVGEPAVIEWAVYRVICDEPSFDDVVVSPPTFVVLVHTGVSAPFNGTTPITANPPVGIVVFNV